MAEVLRNAEGKRVKKDGTEYKSPVRSNLNKILGKMALVVEMQTGLENEAVDNIIAETLKELSPVILEKCGFIVATSKKEGN